MVADAAELEAFSPGAAGGLLTVVGVQGVPYGLFRLTLEHFSSYDERYEVHSAVAVKVEREYDEPEHEHVRRSGWQQRARESVAELRGRRSGGGAGASRGHRHNAAHALEGQPALRAKYWCADTDRFPIEQLSD